MRRTFAFLLTLALAAAVGSAQSKSKTLDIYYLDMEGGHSTLYVAPTANRSSWIPAARGAAMSTASWPPFKPPA